jgi:hypothetical protein
MYNEEYAAMLGKRHPSVLDQGSTRAWPELRGSFDQHFGRGKEIGELLKGDDTFYITERNGYSEGLWASWAILPVAAEDGGIGFYNSVFETTKQVLAERHMSTLVLLGRHISAAANSQDLFKQAMRALEPNHCDTPFAAVYAFASPDTSVQRPQVPIN